MTRTIRLIAAAIVSTGVLLPGAFAAGEQLLQDDYVIAGVDGRLVEAGPDKWVFEFDSQIASGAPGEAIAGQTLELLNSATLEKMVADSKQRSDAQYRLWGKVTKFGGRNYVFAAYFLGLRKVDRPASRPPAVGEDKTRQSINAPNDILSIPDEIVAKLQTSEVLPAQETPAGLQLKQDTIFANRTGHIVEKDGRYVFELDGLGWGVEKFSVELLPCQVLEDAIAQVQSEPNPVRFNVAGILTKYKDRQYLLLQKATRAYSYGNFGG